jgi:diaminohydroxyphosphoribosylaminopyrimidine deaminase / 5-amino-6-(5-phosphoribosylamino)uracil reductase
VEDVRGRSRIERDAFFMRKALRLAERGRGRTSPNPMVGALVVDADGVIVGRGAHEFAGGPHAEVIALSDAGPRSRGATLYCTLEPCNHLGRTGPCAPLVAEAGVSRVVIAAEDSNPVATGGSRFLRDRGIDVTSGVLADAARRLNAPFLTRITLRRPLVTMKIAISMDGRIAQRIGVRTTLTGAAANRQVHFERAEVDAIAVGAGTVLTDDPVLTARGAYRSLPFTRVLYDRNLAVPPSSRMFSTLDAGPVIIVCTGRAIENRPVHAAALCAAGAELLPTGNHDEIRDSLSALADRGVSSLVVEGGARLHQAFWDAGTVDRVQMYVTQHVLGGTGVGWLPGPVLSSDRIGRRAARPVGDDVLLEGYVHGAH